MFTDDESIEIECIDVGFYPLNGDLHILLLEVHMSQSECVQTVLFTYNFNKLHYASFLSHM